MRTWPIAVRRARHGDGETVRGFTGATFPGWGDYISDVFDEWVDAADGVFLVATVSGQGARDAGGEPLEAGRVVAIARVMLPSHNEAWLEGIRVDPRVRGLGVATDLQVAQLRWAAMHGSAVVRYLTGEHNQGSHRLGARHGFQKVLVTRWYGWDDRQRPEPPAPLGASAAGAVLHPGSDADAWWDALWNDRTFAAASRSYEPRSWALQALTRERFGSHVDAGEVIVWPAEAAVRGPSTSAWGLAITRLGPEGEDDPRIPPSPSLVAGDGEAVLELLRGMGRGAPGIPMARLPDPDPPMLAGGMAEAWSAAGWERHDRTTWVFQRLIDADHPLPEPDDPALLTYEDEPRRVAHPRPPPTAAVEERIP